MDFETFEADELRACNATLRQAPSVESADLPPAMGWAIVELKK